jgi:hypothetical protein
VPLLLDIGLPKLNGYEVACRRSREAGFDGHLIKPVGHAELM